MYFLIATVFVLGYVAIALEHPLKIDKAASALFIAILCWTLLIMNGETLIGEHGSALTKVVEGELMHHLSEISGILFFLLGAMTIVEIIDSHGAFDLITEKIRTTKKVKLMWIMSLITFFMSATLDNLTTSIVMATLLRKLIKDKDDLWFFAGMLIIAANAGGAFSPIGDVTTIMLWIGGQVSVVNIITTLLLPSLVCILVPLLILTVTMKGKVEKPVLTDQDRQADFVLPLWEKQLILFLGVFSLLFVPVFKALTHLPPFMGILLGLSVLWGTTELLHINKPHFKKKYLSIARIIENVDTPSILFFLGILLAVSALQTAGHLGDLSHFLEREVGNIWVINTLIGLLSSIVDNVPLVAGAMGMYSMKTFPQDHTFWELLAYCAGTGGSALIIGSAAGVAVMGILKIDFIYYLKRISLLALIGYFSGIGCFWLMNYWMG